MLVSIIVPNLNYGKYLRQCIDSVIRQDDTEIIVMDGGSTDESLDILRAYKTVAGFRFVLCEDTCAGDAWVQGMKLAKGDILGFLGADDVLAPHAISRVIDFFHDNPQAMFVFGSCDYIDEDGRTTKKIVPGDFDLSKAVNDKCEIPATSAFYRREVVETVDTSVISKYDCELDYWIAVGEKYRLYRIDDVLSGYRVWKDKRHPHTEFFDYTDIYWRMGRNHGMKLWSPNAVRYYAAAMLKPFGFVINPLYMKLTTNWKG